MTNKKENTHLSAWILALQVNAKIRQSLVFLSTINEYFVLKHMQKKTTLGYVGLLKIPITTALIAKL